MIENKIEVQLDTDFNSVLSYLKQHSNSIIENSNGIININFDDNIKEGVLSVGMSIIPYYQTEAVDLHKFYFFKTKYIAKQNIHINYSKSNSSENLILFFIKSSLPFEGKIDDKVHSYSAGFYNIVCNSINDYELFFSSGTQVEAISIHISIESLEFLTHGKDFENNPNFRIQDFRFYHISGNSYKYKVFNKAINIQCSTVNEKFELQNIILQLINLGISSIYQNKESSNSNGIKQFDLESLIRAEEYLVSDLKTATSIKTLSNIAAMSTTKLKILFKSYYGCSIHNYYIMHKMDKAFVLLQDNNMTISQIASELGYINKSHFSRTFKKYFGKYPSDYSKN